MSDVTDSPRAGDGSSNGSSKDVREVQEEGEGPARFVEE
ncbi:hypothetical protein BIW11_03513 [Tropilaelaps mercedesae]|uniref:Uncharacterized protein n=1 Tax=Tropilaelaps mercedesae TaxID=418985 RepID=A0A1V9XJR1_9ACAR|nr:hypothetical protein BIW11_03513 [Tropilaelaps mercedesae]